MDGQKKRLSRLSCHSKSVALSSQWNIIHLQEFITKIRKLKSLNKCRLLRQTNSQLLPSSQRSIARKSPLIQCWKIRRRLFATPLSVSNWNIPINPRNMSITITTTEKKHLEITWLQLISALFTSISIIYTLRHCKFVRAMCRNFSRKRHKWSRKTTNKAKTIW